MSTVHHFDSGHMSDSGLRNISFSSLSFCRNAEMKSKLSTHLFIIKAVNITICIASLLHFEESIFRLCESSSKPCATRQAFIIFFLFLNFSIITHLADMHFWLMLVTHSYTPWISIFSISLLFASISSFNCSCSDMSKTTCSSFTSSVTIDTDRIFIFSFWLYIQPITIFSSWFRLFTHNPSHFPLITSFHFIFHKFASTWFFTAVFQFLPVDIKTFIMLSFIFLPQDLFISFWAVLFPSFLGLWIFLLVFKWHGCILWNTLPCLISMHWSSLPNALAGPCYPL